MAVFLPWNLSGSCENCKCCKIKRIEAFKSKCGIFVNSTPPSYYLQTAWHCNDPSCNATSLYGTKTIYDRKSCNSTNYPNPSFQPGSCFCEVSCSPPDGETSCSATGGTDPDTYTVNITNEYTDGDLDADIMELYGSCSFGSLNWGDFASPAFDSGGSPDCSAVTTDASCSDPFALFYQDDGHTFVQKRWAQFVAVNTTYCQTFYPQSGGSPTTSTVTYTIGDTITIDPPSTPGEIYMTPGPC